MNRASLVAFVAGVIFAVGLGLAGMLQPAKVMGFLDFLGAWDPSLALVMVGAIGVNTLVYHLGVKGKEKALLGMTFNLPTRKDLDAKLLGGAAIFGVGWGLGGFCPGPGLVSLATLAKGGTAALTFVGTMLVGMWVFQLVESRKGA
jgi:uncharacterized membrane protein YedE/YeeE